jgi:hypothetical protein
VVQGWLQAPYDLAQATEREDQIITRSFKRIRMRGVQELWLEREGVGEKELHGSFRLGFVLFHHIHVTRTWGLRGAYVGSMNYQDTPPKFSLVLFF